MIAGDIRSIKYHIDFVSKWPPPGTFYVERHVGLCYVKEKGRTFMAPCPLRVGARRQNEVYVLVCRGGAKFVVSPANPIPGVSL
jgi:hypothetical protein